MYLFVVILLLPSIVKGQEPPGNNCGIAADCVDNADCIVSVCTCTAPFVTSNDGLTCINDVDECALGTDTCDVNAICSNTIGSFSCTCNSGYAQNGDACADADECIIGTDNCDTNALCTNTVGSFTCACNAGYAGDGTTCTDEDECALATDNCDTNAVCTNTVGSFTCACNIGYAGDGTACTDNDECALDSDNCDINALCTNTDGSFTCACNAGYNGDGVTCTDDDECTLATDNCDINALCTNTPGSFICACYAGYAGDGVTCTDDDECTLTTDNCDINALCTNTPGSFTCVCNAGYNGDGGTCTDDDECTLATDNCDINALCTNTPGSFTCVCNAGYNGDGVTCTDDDECTLATDNCDTNALCTNTAGSFICACNAGYNGDGTTCTDEDECTLDTDNCDINAVCTNTAGSFTCACNTGYTGDGTVCTDDDECTLDTDNCDINALCTNTAGSFTCACNDGYNGDGTACADEDECTLGTDNCDVNALCTNTAGSFVCACNDGYAGDGTACTDIDECILATDNCDTNALCTNTAGSFTCVCNAGYAGDGTVCTDNDECTLATDNCDINALCTNTAGSFTCACNAGYNGDGTACADVEECTTNTDNCDANALCTNTVGSFTCACNAGYAGDGTTCTDDDECTLATDNCDINALCTNTAGSFTCACNTGYVGDGTTCTDVDECTLDTDNCDTKALCTNTVGSFTCACNIGYAGDGTVCTDVDECTLDTDNCDINALCTNTAGSFTCACNTGYAGDGTACTDEDECTLDTDNCDVNALCTNTAGSFVCACNAGYAGDGTVCTEVDECASNPCDNGGTCLDNINYFECVCPAGYTDVTCRKSVLYDACDASAAICDGIMNAACNGSICACLVGYKDYGNATCHRVDCGPLNTPINGTVYMDQGTLYEAVSTFTCNTGFTMFGSASTTCLSTENWSDPEPVCNVTDCGPLTSPTNGHVTLPATTVYTMATYTCDDGYMLEGGNKRTCGLDGIWDNAVPTCSIKDCGSLSNPSHGTVDVSGGTTYLQTAVYSCNPGYTLTGESIRTCLSDGQWNSTAPTCVIKDCGSLTNPSNGLVTTGDDTLYGDTATYMCHVGYNLVGQTSRTCGTDGTWDGSEPVCNLKDCGPPTAISNGVVISTLTTYGSTATYSCSLNYGLIGPANITCLSTGIWDINIPACGIDCGVPSSITDGVVTYLAGTVLGAEASYTCDLGYSLSGAAIVICQTNGTWSLGPTCEINIHGYGSVCQSLLDCETLEASCMDDGSGTSRCTCRSTTVYNTTLDKCLADCGGLSDPTLGVVSVPQTTEGEIAIYTCNHGYALNGAGTRTCQASGNWSGTAPTCTSGCSEPEATLNGQVNTTNGLTSGSVVTYTCDTGYVLVGSSSRVCLMDKTWSGQRPSCNKECSALPDIEHGTVDMSRGSWSTSVATYICDRNYALVGQSTRMCESTGLWAGEEPTCIVAMVPDIQIAFGVLFFVLILFDIVVVIVFLYKKVYMKRKEDEEEEEEETDEDDAEENVKEKKSHFFPFMVERPDHTRPTSPPPSYPHGHVRKPTYSRPFQEVTKDRDVRLRTSVHPPPRIPHLGHLKVVTIDRHSFLKNPKDKKGATVGRETMFEATTFEPMKDRFKPQTVFKPTVTSSIVPKPKTTKHVNLVGEQPGNDGYNIGNNKDSNLKQAPPPAEADQLSLDDFDLPEPMAHSSMVKTTSPLSQPSLQHPE